MTDTPPPTETSRPNPPQKIRLATGALLLSAASGVIASLSLLGQRAWLKNNIITGDKKNKTPIPSDAKLNSDVTSLMRSELLVSFVVAVLVVLIARSLWRGRYLARWGTVGVMAIATLLSTPIGLFSILSVASSEPFLFKIFSFIGALSMLAAVVLVNTKESVAYLLPTRKPRKPGRQGAASLFGSRPPRAPRGTPPPPPPAARKPANTRPLSQQPKQVQEANGVRGKAKTRTSPDTVEGAANAPAPAPAPASGSRVRGKSRKA